MRNVPLQLKRGACLALLAIGFGVLASPVFPAGIAPEQVIRLKGTTNTRDIGGYPTSDLRSVRSGQIIRSENLSRLTADDFRALEAIGVKTVIDLRTEKERDHAPTVWKGDHAPQFFHFPVLDDDNDWFRSQRRMFKRNRFSEEQALDHMVEGYRAIAEDGAASYRNLIDVLLDESNWPVLIHCSAGKDRSGIAVALILEALGVKRKVIMDEYLLTNEIGRIEDKAKILAKDSRSQRGVGKGPSAEAWLPIVGVHPDMLEAFYRSVDAKYGSMDAYLAELGLDRQARERLAASLTTEQAALAMRK